MCLRKIFGWLFGSGSSRSGEMMDKLEEADDFDLGLEHVAEIEKPRPTAARKVKKKATKKPAKKKSAKRAAKKPKRASRKRR